MDDIERKNFWEKCLLSIKKNYTIQQFKTWVDPISIKDLQISKTSIMITLLAPNKYKQQWALNHLSPTLKNWISTNYSKPVLLTIEVRANPIELDSSKATKELQLQTGDNLTNNKNQQQRGETTNRIQNPHLNPDWTFDN
ncbi:MAG: DnaA N-terminal domain-containing protein, partial [Burkholderiaceae bacterium]